MFDHAVAATDVRLAARWVVFDVLLRELAHGVRHRVGVGQTIALRDRTNGGVEIDRLAAPGSRGRSVHFGDFSTRSLRQLDRGQMRVGCAVVLESRPDRRGRGSRSSILGHSQREGRHELGRRSSSVKSSGIPKFLSWRMSSSIEFVAGRAVGLVVRN